MHICALYDYPAIAKLFLDHKANINAKNKDGRTPLDVAIANHSVFTASLLISRDCQLGTLTKNIFTIINDADDVNLWRPVLKIITKMFNSMEHAPPLLHRALENGDSQAVALLLEESFDPNCSDRGFLPIHHAVMLGRLPEVELLVKHGADVNAHLSVGALQFRRGQDVPRQRLINEWDRGRDFTPLTILATKTDPTSIAIFKFLLANGADPNFFLPVYGKLLPWLSQPQLPRYSYFSQAGRALIASVHANTCPSQKP